MSYKRIASLLVMLALAAVAGARSAAAQEREAEVALQQALHVEQVEYGHRCDYPGTYSGDPRTSLARVSAAVPGLRNLIDVTTQLANYLASGNPEYFQIRLRFEGDNGGRAYASMVEWSTIRLTIEYER